MSIINCYEVVIIEENSILYFLDIKPKPVSLFLQFKSCKYFFKYKYSTIEFYYEKIGKYAENILIPYLRGILLTEAALYKDKYERDLKKKISSVIFSLNDKISS